MSFTSLSQLARQAEDRGLSIARLMMSVEEQQSGLDEDQLMAKMASQFAVMEQAVRKGILEPERSRMGLTGQDAARVHTYLERGASFVPPEPLRAMAYALAVSEVNAAMGRIVATPTAGAAGILPGVLVSLLDSGRYTRDQLVWSLFTAAALGLAIANAACISGAAGGCQAEVGSATAMAAGALVELAGGSPQAAVHAAALALQNSLGLVCDPVAGLVEVPCVTRNGLHAITALAAADMALAGVRSVIPPDEVVDAMRQIGQEMPVSLRETGLGGLAGTPTGRAYRVKVFGEDELLDSGASSGRPQSGLARPCDAASEEQSSARDGRVTGEIQQRL
ncbi:MAG: L-serine ammonia-lyase, iron-sulfur-dependent, subunit alpha [Alicyclobacillus shizuokensis]|nr:L-serine ammonia-lyase, iron-sulfur-dependent, subunit alpha [Alicyclobacillus shizuokensis]